MDKLDSQRCLGQVHSPFTRLAFEISPAIALERHRNTVTGSTLMFLQGVVSPGCRGIGWVQGYRLRL